MLEWKDTTSYSKGDKERLPTTFSVSPGKLRITITSAHIYYPGQWVMHCRPFFDTFWLDADTLEDAKANALALVRAEIKAVVAELDKC